MSYAIFNLFAAGEDFTAFNKNVMIPIGLSRHCVPIIILEDDIFEKDESFELVVEQMDFSTSTTIIILNDEGN